MGAVADALSSRLRARSGLGSQCSSIQPWLNVIANTFPECQSAFDELPKLRTTHAASMRSIWITATSASDVLIALTLLWQITVVKKQHTVTGGERCGRLARGIFSPAHCNPSSGRSRMGGVLQRLALTTVQTGTVTAVTALAVLGSYLGAPQINGKCLP